MTMGGGVHRAHFRCNKDGGKADAAGVSFTMAVNALEWELQPRREQQ